MVGLIGLAGGVKGFHLFLLDKYLSETQYNNNCVVSVSRVVEIG